MARLGALLQARPWLVFLPVVAVVFVGISDPAPAAVDDLLRHIASGFYPGGYHDMYAYGAMPATEQYPLFDRAAGALGRTFGPVPAMWLIQSLAGIGFVLVFVAAAYRVLPAGEDREYWVLAAVVLVTGAIVVRLALARPEMFMAIWALAALIPTGRLGVAVWCLVGLFMSTGYWLAGLYFPAVLLLPLSLRNRLLVGMSLGIGWALLWKAVTGIWPWVNLQELSAVLGGRIETISIGENASVVNLLALPEMFALLAAAAWALTRRPGGNAWILLLAGFYALSNQARFVGIIAPLLALYALSASGQTRLSWSPGARISAILVSAVLAYDATFDVPRMSQLPSMRLPAGSLVLTGANSAVFAMPFFNQGRVRIAPPMEIGAAERWVQEIAAELSQGRFDCASISGRGFTHLVEFSLTGAPPLCLRLVETQGGWRLWEVVGPIRAPAVDAT